MDRELIEKIKKANDLVEIIGEKVALKKSGNKLRGLSPFTNEKSPSFFVWPDLQRFYCFSQNVGGDVVRFVMLTRGMSFPEALEFLAKKAGIKVNVANLSPQEQKKRSEEEEKAKLLFKLNRFAAHYFQNQFLGESGEEARAYAEKRGLSKSTLEAFGIGFAPDSWSGLKDYLVSIKAPLKEATALGLLRTKADEAPRQDGANLYDFFRHRLMFPIRNPNGDVIGFGGRAMGNEADTVKYLNSPESPVYDKGSSLYNLDRARKFIREADTVILVEGYMDCIALDQAGIQNVVANLGTALTPQHVHLLCKLASKVICLYDADAAGQRALERNMDLFLEHAGIPLLGTQVPSGKDPDEYLRAHGEDGRILLRKHLSEAPAWLDIWSARLVKEAASTLHSRTEVLEKIAEKIALLKDDLWIKVRIPQLTQNLQFREDIVIEAIKKYRKRTSKDASNVQTKPLKSLENKNYSAQKIEQKQTQNDKKTHSFEWQFLQDLLRSEDWIAQLREISTSDPQAIPTFANKEVEKIIRFLVTPLNNSETEEQRLERLLEDLGQDEKLESFVYRAISERGTWVAAKDLKDYVNNFKKQFIKRRQQEIKEQIANAERMGDHGLREKLQKEAMLIARMVKLGEKE